MIRTSLLAATLLAALPACNAAAQSYKYKTITDGKTMQTSMHDINAAGTAVGGVFAALGDVRNCIILNGKKITTISDPNGTGGTECWGISSSGTIVGDYVDSNGNYNGYIYSNSTFTDIKPPKSAYTVVYGVNASGTAIGYYLDKSGNSYGFIFNGKKYTVINVKGGTGTEGFGIDDAGDYTYSTVLSDGLEHSYLVASGKTTELIWPTEAQAVVHHMNNKGQISATVIDSAGTDHAGVYDGTSGTYYVLDDPKGASTIGDGINDSLTVVGRYNTDAGASYGYVAKGKL
jgi:hypothetical protein